MMEKFSLAANLKMCFQTQHWPESLKEHQQLITKCFDTDTRGTLLNDIGWFQSRITPHDEDEEWSVMESQESIKPFSQEVYDALHLFCKKEKIVLPFPLPKSGTHLKSLQHGAWKYSPYIKDPNVTVPTNGDSQVLI
ncbi:MAG TPA: hypothetical protein VGO47_03055, partial [Chlamydiales bacterium]|nr:hypothetical protein [Chlamydiales bacterium]